MGVAATPKPWLSAIKYDNTNTKILAVMWRVLWRKSAKILWYGSLLGSPLFCNNKVTHISQISDFTQGWMDTKRHKQTIERN